MKEISSDLNITPKTVETHKQNIRAKLGTSNLAILTRHALKLGLVDLDGRALIIPLVCVALVLSSCAHNHLPVAPVYSPPINTGQLDLSCSPQPDAAVRAVFDRALASNYSLILCALDNNSHEQISFSDARLYRALAYLHPVSRSAMGLVTSNEDKNNHVARAERIIPGVTAGINIAIEDKSLSVPLGVASAAAFTIAYAPTLLKWLGMVAPNTSGAYQQLSQLGPVTIPSGGSALFYVMTQKWDWGAGTPPIQFSISVDNLPAVKMAQ